MSSACNMRARSSGLRMAFAIGLGMLAFPLAAAPPVAETQAPTQAPKGARPRVPVAQQSYITGDFDTIRVEAPVSVVITTGKGASARGFGPRALLDAISLDMASRTLIIRMRDSGLQRRGSGGTARIEITTGTLTRLFLSGAGSVAVDRMRGDRITMAQNGSGSVSVARIDAGTVDLGAQGSGSLSIAAGKVDVAGAAVGGSGSIETTGLDVARLTLHIEGSAQARMTARSTASVVASGAASATVTGPAACTVRRFGSAAVSCGGDDY
jgi:hypothetical protein